MLPLPCSKAEIAAGDPSLQPPGQGYTFQEFRARSMSVSLAPWEALFLFPIRP
jgi:hypothetical protein